MNNKIIITKRWTSKVEKYYIRRGRHNETNLMIKSHKKTQLKTLDKHSYFFCNITINIYYLCNKYAICILL